MNPTAPGGLPLSDLRVIDLSIARSGPVCIRQFADWGADVVRVEAPDPDAELLPRRSADFENLHRNKRSVAIDLRTDAGRDVLYRLVETADVFIENMRPQVKTRLGVDYATLAEVNPRLIYGSISGFGQHGPYADRGGVDQIAQGMGGLMAVTGQPGQGPMRAGAAVADVAAGLYLALGVLTALHHRERTGKGQWVQTSLLEAMIGIMDFQAARWTIAREVPVQEGNHHPTAVPMGCFESSDGHVNIAGAFGRLWERFCDATGLEQLLTDPRFASSDARHRHRRELNEIVGARLRQRPSQEWVELLNGVGVPCGPVYAMNEVFDDPQVRHLAMTQRLSHPDLGEVSYVRSPYHVGADAGAVHAPAPGHGLHTCEVLREAGYSTGDIDRLVAGGTVILGDPR